MSTTPARAYPYPGLLAPPDVPADIAALALAVDADIDTLAQRITGAPITFTPSWAGAGSFNKGISTIAGEKWKVGNHSHVVIEVAITTGSGFNSGSAGWQFGTLGITPSGSLNNSRVAGHWWLAKGGSAVRYTGAVLYAGASLNVVCQAGGGDSDAAEGFTQLGGVAVPAAWATGDLLTLDFWIPGV